VQTPLSRSGQYHGSREISERAQQSKGINQSLQMLQGEGIIIIHLHQHHQQCLFMDEPEFITILALSYRKEYTVINFFFMYLLSVFHYTVHGIKSFTTKVTVYLQPHLRETQPCVHQGQTYHPLDIHILDRT
jgi:hypothetical protein